MRGRSSICFALALLAATARSETREPLTMEAALRVAPPTVSNLRWATDSSRLLASLKEPGASAATIETWRLQSGERRTVVSGDHAAPSPDGRWLVYLGGRRWQLRSLVDGRTTPLGEEAPYTPTVFSPPTWSRDSRFIAIIDTLRPPDAPFGVEPENQDGVRVLDVGRVAEGPARAARDEPRITIIDIRSPSTPREISIAETHLYYGEWGRDTDFYFVAMQGYWNGTPTYTALKHLDARTLAITETFRMEGGFFQGAAPRVSPDGKYIALALDIDTRRWDDYNSLMLVDARSGAMRRLTSDRYVVGRSLVWARDGKSLYFAARAGGLDQIYRVGLDGKTERITQDERRHFDLGLSPDGAWLSYQTHDGYGRKDLRLRSLRTGEEQVVTVLGDPAHDFRLGAFRHVQWESTDGLRIYGFVFLPPGFGPTKKYPLYVDVHGGGPGARLSLGGTLGLALGGTPLEWHAWATLGYVVFVPDMRSSGEYGPQVAAARYGARSWDWSGMAKDVEDIESGTRWMLLQGYVDANRVAVFGHSAGGGRVNLLLTQSRLYGAGIIHDPIHAGALPFTLSATTGRKTGAGFDERFLSNGQRLADAPEVFTNGFLFDGYKSRTPTLLLVGNPDHGGIDPLSSEVLFSVLRQYGVPTRMLRYVDEGHNPATAASALHRYREIRGWLEKYIP